MGMACLFAHLRTHCGACCCYCMMQSSCCHEIGASKLHTQPDIADPIWLHKACGLAQRASESTVAVEGHRPPMTQRIFSVLVHRVPIDTCIQRPCVCQALSEGIAVYMQCRFITLTFLMQVTSKSAALLPVPACGKTLLPDDTASKLACNSLDNR